MRMPFYGWLGGMVSVLSLAACAGGATGEGAPQPRAGGTAPEARCDAQAAQTLVGQPFTGDTVARVQAATGAQEARLLRPDSAVTKEFKMGRVNVVVDANQRVVRVYCG